MRKAASSNSLVLSSEGTEENSTRRNICAINKILITIIYMNGEGQAERVGTVTSYDGINEAESSTW